MNENNQSGFTLIELLGILVLIAIIGIIAFVAIDRSLKDGKQEAYEKQIRMIELAVENWASDNFDKLPAEGKSITMTLAGLKLLGYVVIDVSDPITGKCFPNDTKIVISRLNGKYSYQVDQDSIENGVMACDTFDDDGDIIIQEPLITIEGGETPLNSDQTTTFTIVSNMSGLDTSKIKLVDSLDTYEEPTASEIVSIGDEALSTSGTGYEREVVIKAGSTDETIWLIVEPGAIVNSEGIESDLVISNGVVIDNTVLDTEEGPRYLAVCNNECVNNYNCSEAQIAQGVYCEVALVMSGSTIVVQDGGYVVNMNSSPNYTEIMMNTSLYTYDDDIFSAELLSVIDDYSNYFTTSHLEYDSYLFGHVSGVKARLPFAEEISGSQGVLYSWALPSPGSEYLTGSYNFLSNTSGEGIGSYVYSVTSDGLEHYDGPTFVTGHDFQLRPVVRVYSLNMWGGIDAANFDMLYSNYLGKTYSEINS